MTEKQSTRTKAPTRGGARPGAGRKKGVPNKLTTELKSMILGALDDAGGQKYLASQAKKNPVAFLTLVGKVLPMTVSGADGGDIQHSIRVTFG